MQTDGIETVYLETHNWGRAAKFFQSLGYEIDFETGHSSGMLRNTIGPAIFIAEVPVEQAPASQPALRVPDTDHFEPGPEVEVVTPFEDSHWGTKLMTVRDPDGRTWWIEASGQK